MFTEKRMAKCARRLHLGTGSTAFGIHRITLRMWLKLADWEASGAAEKLLCLVRMILPDWVRWPTYAAS